MISQILKEKYVTKRKSKWKPLIKLYRLKNYCYKSGGKYII